MKWNMRKIRVALNLIHHDITEIKCTKIKQNLVDFFYFLFQLLSVRLLTPIVPRANVCDKSMKFVLNWNPIAITYEASRSFFPVFIVIFLAIAFSDESSNKMNVDFNRFMTWKKIIKWSCLVDYLWPFFTHLYFISTTESRTFFASEYHFIYDWSSTLVLWWCGGSERRKFHMKFNQLRPSLPSRVQRKSLNTVIKVHNNCNLHSARKKTAKTRKFIRIEIHNSFIKAKGNIKDKIADRRRNGGGCCCTLNSGEASPVKSLHSRLTFPIFHDVNCIINCWVLITIKFYVNRVNQTALPHEQYTVHPHTDCLKIENSRANRSIYSS